MNLDPINFLRTLSIDADSITMSELTQLRNVNPQESRGYLSNEFLQSHTFLFRHLQRRGALAWKKMSWLSRHLSRMTLRDNNDQGPRRARENSVPITL